MSHDSHHDSDDGHERGTLQTRRAFLRTSLLGAAASWTLPTFINSTFNVLHADAADRATQIVTGTDGPILVVLQQAGGNDGLNMLPPWADDAYHRARPSLGIAADKVLKLDGYCGLHPALSPLKALYDGGNMAVVQGVGYPNPNRSHFRSTEIWQTASDSNRNQPYGWLGQYFDHCCQGAPATVGRPSAGRLRRRSVRRIPTGVSFANPEQYRWIDHNAPGGTAALAETFFRQMSQPDDLSSGGSIGAVSGQHARQG